MKLLRMLAGVTLTVGAATGTGATQSINLRYGQIPSTIKTVSALQFHLA